MPEKDKLPEVDDEKIKERTEQEVLLDKRIEQLREGTKRRNRRMSRNVAVILVNLGIALAAAYMTREYLFTEENFVLILMGAGALIFFSAQIFNSGETDTTALQVDLDKLLLDKEVSERVRARTQGLPPETTPEPPSYFDQLVDTNVVYLREYYHLVRVHTSNSFRVSLFAGVVGFLLIAAGLTIGFNAGAEARDIAYLSAASGLFIEFISGVFFFLYSGTVRQLKAYHDSLLDVQDVLLSLKLIEGLEDDARSRMIGEMLKFLMERKKEVIPVPKETSS